MSLLLRRIASLRLSNDDQAAVRSLETRPNDYPAGALVLDEGEELARCGLLAEGWALRARTMPDGRRQVIEVMPPGSLFAIEAFGVAHSDQSVTTITPAKICWFPPAKLEALFGSNPRAGLAITWMEACEQSMLAERLMSLGRRSAYERIGHALIELGRRLKARGLSDGSRFRLPLTNEILADLLGMSIVHVSRTLAKLEGDGHITRHRREIELVLSSDFLAAVSFDPAYLHEGDARARIGRPASGDR